MLNRKPHMCPSCCGMFQRKPCDSKWEKGLTLIQSGRSDSRCKHRKISNWSEQWGRKGRVSSQGSKGENPWGKKTKKLLKG